MPDEDAEAVAWVVVVTEDGKAVVAISKDEASRAEVVVVVGLIKLRAGFRGADTFLFAIEKLGTTDAEEGAALTGVAAVS